MQLSDHLRSTVQNCKAVIINQTTKSQHLENTTMLSTSRITTFLKPSNSESPPWASTSRHR
ncbi:hypothetical protein GBA52_026573 [Prunus armeniaca]|nr:hypothetical protein GBA52_026573 [Prunus armeniaca]